MGQIILELSGMPGSGKTTAIHALSRKYTEYDFMTDACFYGKESRILNKIRLLVYWGDPRNKAVRTILNQLKISCISSKSNYLFFKKKLNILRCFSLYRQKAKRNIALSEGVIQGIFEVLDLIEPEKTVMAIPFCTDIFAELVQQIPHLQCFILFLDHDTAEQRISRRKDPANSVDRMINRLNFLKKREENAALVFRALSEAGFSGNVSALNAAGNAEQCLEAISKALTDKGKDNDL